MTCEPMDKPFKRRRILPAYQELLDSGALQGGTDSTQIIREDRDTEASPRTPHLQAARSARSASLSLLPADAQVSVVESAP